MLKTTREQLDQMKARHEFLTGVGFAHSIEDTIALLHDAAVAHRLVAGVREVLTALNRRSEGYRHRTFDECNLGAHDEVDDCRTMLEALLSAAKGAE